MVRGIQTIQPMTTEAKGHPMTAPANDLAAKIAAELFSSGDGKHAVRLQFILEGGTVWGGWSEPAMAAHIAKALAPTLDALAAAQADYALVQKLYLSEKQAKVERGDAMCDAQDALAKAEADCAALRLALDNLLQHALHPDTMAGEMLSDEEAAGIRVHYDAAHAALQATDAGKRK